MHRSYVRRRPIMMGLAIAIAGLARIGVAGAAEGRGEEPDAVRIYTDVPAEGAEDTRSDVERLFAPFGLMPASRTTQVTVNQAKPVDAADRSKGTCIEYHFEFQAPDDWMGAYTLVEGNCWGTKPGINVPELLGVSPATQLAVRFSARGEGSVTFKSGGVRDGDHPSSLRPEVAATESPTLLTPEFREITIGPIPAGKLTNLIDPLCVVTTILDNPGRESVRVEVDSLRVEPFDNPALETSLPDGWRERLAQTFFVTYTPTGFDPTASPVKRPTADEIRADLTAIRALADRAGIAGDRAGIITYGCRDGLEQIAPLAREAKLSVLLGIFNPRDPDEVRNAEALLGRLDLERTIVGCCVGNEAITFRRATLEEIRVVMQQLIRIRRIPATTTEIVQSYGDKRLFQFDFSLINAHAIFSEIFDPEQGAHWAIDHLQDVVDSAPPGHLILAKELGWPSGPGPVFDDHQQAAYWKFVLNHSIARRVNVCVFDGLANVAWKNETITVPGHDPVNIGPHWPVLFGPERRPKPIAKELLRLWKESRGE